MRHKVRFGFVILAALACAMPACAISFHFSPTSIMIEARPGQTVNRSLTLTLAKDAGPTQFKARIEDWWRSAENDRTFYAAPGTLKRSCGKWCTINPMETAVGSGNTMTVKLSIRIPDDAKPGGYWTALTIDEVPDPTVSRPEGVAMTFRASLSVGIYIEIPVVTKKARITGVTVDKKVARVTLINEGNTPLRINGSFEFYKIGDDKPIATITLGGEPLLPEPINTCAFSCALPDAQKLPSGKYKVRVIVEAGLDHLMGAEKEIGILRTDTR